jgi:hypothetical protein
MPKRISDVFQIESHRLTEHNIFNGFVDIDSEFHVDPRLLLQTSAIELQNSYKKVTNYFDNILCDALNYVENLNHQNLY